MQTTDEETPSIEELQKNTSLPLIVTNNQGIIISIPHSALQLETRGNYSKDKSKKSRKIK